MRELQSVVANDCCGDETKDVSVKVNGVARLDYGAFELALAQFELQQRVLPFHAKKLFVLFLVAVLKLLADTLVCIECFKLLADSTQVDAGESEELLHKSMYESQILYRLKLLHPFF